MSSSDPIIKRTTAVIPKTLLVTWTPPGDRNVGEIILRDLCSFFPDDRLSVCEVSRFSPGPGVQRGLRIVAPDERPWRPLAGRAGGLLNYLRIRATFARQADALVGQIADFAKSEGAEQIWTTLNSQTLVRLSAKLKAMSGLPMRSLVWDPVRFLARHQGWDAASAAWAQSNFDAAMAVSESAMVVSESMAAQYGERFGLPCSIVRHAFDIDHPREPLDDDGFIKIGFAGTLYDSSQLNCLIQALAALGWRVGGRKLKLRIIGNYFRFNRLNAPANIELLGWRTSEDARKLLRECAFSYLPIPFGSYFSEFARMAFPTKLSTYLAADRPVLVHAPDYADAANFCRTQGVGAVCGSMDPEELRLCVEEMVERMDDVALRDAVERTCRDHFSRPVMRRNFADFMGVDERALLA